jgi:hypothetical protein
MTSTTTDSQKPFYFNLFTSGWGYLHDIREVTLENGKKGNPYLCCRINAVNGERGAVSYVPFDTIVKGEDARNLVLRCIEAVDAKKTVFVNFKLGDLRTEIYKCKKGKHKGEQRVALKTHLLILYRIKIDGNLVYPDEPRSEGERPSDVPVDDPTLVESSAGDDVSAEVSDSAEAESESF